MPSHPGIESRQLPEIPQQKTIEQEKDQRIVALVEIVHQAMQVTQNHRSLLARSRRKGVGYRTQFRSRKRSRFEGLDEPGILRQGTQARFEPLLRLRNPFGRNQRRHQTHGKEQPYERRGNRPYARREGQGKVDKRKYLHGRHNPLATGKDGGRKSISGHGDVAPPPARHPPRSSKVQTQVGQGRQFTHRLLPVGYRYHIGERPAQPVGQPTTTRLGGRAVDIGKERFLAEDVEVGRKIMRGIEKLDPPVAIREVVLRQTELLPTNLHRRFDITPAGKEAAMHLDQSQEGCHESNGHRPHHRCGTPVAPPHQPGNKQ